MLLVTLFVALLGGLSAAFASWLCCVALTDCFLALFARDTLGGKLAALDPVHERTA